MKEKIGETDVRIRHLAASNQALSITSPVDGKILTHDPKALAGLWVKPGDPILSIGTSEGFVVDGDLKEDFLPRVRPGLMTKVYLRAFPFREYQVLEGELTGIGERFETAGDDGKECYSDSHSASGYGDKTKRGDLPPAAGTLGRPENRH